MLLNKIILNKAVTKEFTPFVTASFLQYEQFQNKHAAAARYSNLKQTRAKPRRYNAYKKRQRTGKRALRRIDNRRESHDSQRNIRYVI